MIDPQHLRECVIRPTLDHIGLWSESAEELLMLTAAQESAMGRYLRQITGPAVGVFQMEPATHKDHWANYLAYKPDLAERVLGLRLGWTDDRAQEMAGNLYYAAAMARVHYRRNPNALPRAQDVRGLAAYWKAAYNTPLGHGTVEQAIESYKRYVERAE